jgi:hypothetical protein
MQLDAELEVKRRPDSQSRRGLVAARPLEATAFEVGDSVRVRVFPGRAQLTSSASGQACVSGVAAGATPESVVASGPAAPSWTTVAPLSRDPPPALEVEALLLPVPVPVLAPAPVLLLAPASSDGPVESPPPQAREKVTSAAARTMNVRRGVETWCDVFDSMGFSWGPAGRLAWTASKGR